MTQSKLFTPITLRGLTLDNRIVLSPMCQYASKDGHASEWHTVHLGTYALANLGLVITEATAVEPEGRISPMCLGLYSDAHQEGLARVVRFYRDEHPDLAELARSLPAPGSGGSLSGAYAAVAAARR